ncbi:MAG: hypothetical protein ACREMJ_05100 [Gemmatimonadales bacterium]
MKPGPLATITFLGVCVGLTACGPLRKSNGAKTPDGVSFERGGVILTGSALEDGSGSILSTISGKVPNFKVQRQSGRCPQITLRSHVRFEAGMNPQVYVDGTRSTDTCILETLQAGDVDRVEVYPQGFTTRPGYASHADGLILVFMRSS